MSQHTSRSTILQSIVLRYVYYRIERAGTNRSMLGYCNANKPRINKKLYNKRIKIVNIYFYNYTNFCGLQIIEK